MKKTLKVISLICLVMNLSCGEDKRGEETNKTAPETEETALQNIHLADPTIFLHDGTYYLYGTSQGNLSEKGKGFLVFTSNDLKNWEGPKGARDGFALKQGDAFGSEGFWAPQVFEHDNKFYMAYTANENIAIASSESPLGPFTNSSEQALEAPVKQIDPFIFIDDDGKKYLYHVRLDKGNRIFVAEMTDDLKRIKPETLQPVVAAMESWENTQNVEWPVAEGPTVVKRNGLYYLLYSANDYRNPDYAVGYATSTTPLGPWEKSDENPIIQKELVGESGPGHGDVVIDENGQMQYVLHTHFSEKNVHPRKTAIVKIHFDDGEFNVDKETFKYLKH